MPAVAVAVSLHKPYLTETEAVSFRHLRTHLGTYDAYWVVPEGLQVDIEGLPLKEFPGRFFRDRHANALLTASRRFYAAFEEYEYVLVYHLDSLVFSDRLSVWCEQGWDYVGAPWVRRLGDGTYSFAGVGNGGLSLRRVESCLAVLDAARRASLRLQRAGVFLRSFGPRLGRAALEGAHSRLRSGDVSGALRRTVPTVVRAAQRSNPYLYEDKFWAFAAPEIKPDFRIPPADVALRFSFEAYPRFCFERTGGQLPFGCHKWTHHDPDFWERFLLR